MCPTHPETVGKEHGIDMVRLRALITPWLDRMCEWERHLRLCKQFLWKGTHAVEGSLVEDRKEMSEKILRRIVFVLTTQWNLFPSGEGGAPARDSLQEEQKYVVSQVNSVPTEDEYKGTTSQQQKLHAEVKWTETRGLIVDFANRLASWY